MKRLKLLFALLYITVSFVSAEGYRPLLKDGRTWVEYSPSAFDYFVYNHRIKGDSIIDGNKYFKLYESFSLYGKEEQGDINESIYESEPINYLLREEDGKLYKYENKKDVLLYDFSLGVNTKINRPDSLSQTITSVDEIQVNNNIFKRLSVTEINEERLSELVEYGLDPDLYSIHWKSKGYWVESIGSSHGLLDAFRWVPGAKGKSYQLTACYDNGKLIFRYSDFESPNFCPMLKQNKSWVYDYYHYNEAKGKYDDPEKYYFYIDGDTTINGKHYYKLSNNHTWKYQVALREEGTTLYCILPGEQEEKVLQEFDPSKFPDEIGKYTVQKDTITVRDTPFVRYQYKPENNGKPMTAVEGVGFKDNGIVYGMYPSEGSDNFSDYMKFKYCIEDGRVIFMNDEFDTQQTNDIKDLYHTANAISRKISNSLFDLQGRRILGTPSRGVYIKGGKKYVKK